MALLAVSLVVLAAGLAAARSRGGHDRGVAFDRNDDGRADPVAWRPATGRWRLGDDTITLGRPGDVAVPGDWDGDGLVDAAVWRPATGLWELPGRGSEQVGLPGDIPVPCDWDGDGDPDPGVWRPDGGGWFSAEGSLGFLGAQGDVPVPADWHEGGACDLAVFRSTDGSWPGTGWREPFGLAGDVPVPGDWDGDGDIERAVWRPATGAWLVDATDGPRAVAHLGLSTDEPQPADWDGDGALEPSVWRPDRGAWLLEDGRVLATGSPGDEALMLAAGVRVVGHPPAASPQAAVAVDTGRTTLADLGPPAGPLGLLLAAAAGAIAAMRRRVKGARALASKALRARRWLDQQTLGDHLLIAGAFALPLGVLRVGPITVADGLLVASAVARVALGRVGALRRLRASVPPVMVLGGGLALIGGLVGGVVGTEGAVGWRALARAAAGVCLPMIAVLLGRGGPRRRRNLALAFALGATVSVVVGLSQVAVGERMAGLATHPNHLGLTALLGMAMAAGVLAAGATPLPTAAVLLLNTLGVVLSGSRAALLGLVVLAAWSFSKPPSARQRARWRTSGYASAAALVAFVTVAHGAALHRLTGDPASDAGRRFRLELALERIHRAPLTGEGFRFLEEAHSVPLQLLAAGGPLTLIGGTLLLVAPVVLGYRDRSNALTRWLLAGWTAYLGVALVQNIVVDRYVWFLAALLAAVALPPVGRGTHGAATAGDHQTDGPATSAVDTQIEREPADWAPSASRLMSTEPPQVSVPPHRPNSASRTAISVLNTLMTHRRSATNGLAVVPGAWRPRPYHRG